MSELNGRRLMRARLEERYRLGVIDEHSTARRVHMAKRKERRNVIRRERAKLRQANPELTTAQLKQRIIFRPVPGYAGLEAPNHKDTIAAMKYAWLHRK